MKELWFGQAVLCQFIINIFCGLDLRPSHCNAHAYQVPSHSALR